MTLLRELREEQGCSQIILGCTELPIIIQECLNKYSGIKESNIVDSAETMVETCVRIAKRDLDIADLMD